MLLTSGGEGGALGRSTPRAPVGSASSRRGRSRRRYGHHHDTKALAGGGITSRNTNLRGLLGWRIFGRQRQGTWALLKTAPGLTVRAIDAMRSSRGLFDDRRTRRRNAADSGSRKGAVPRLLREQERGVAAASADRPHRSFVGMRGLLAAAAPPRLSVRPNG